MASSSVRSVAEIQYSILLDYMEANPDLFIGKITKQFTQERKRALWTEIAEKLNNIESGCKKSVSHWIQVWNLWKFNVKKKATSIKRYGKNGKVPESLKELTDIEERCYALIVSESLRFDSEEDSEKASTESRDEKMEYAVIDNENSLETSMDNTANDKMNSDPDIEMKVDTNVTLDSTENSKVKDCLDEEIGGSPVAGGTFESSIQKMPSQMAREWGTQSINTQYNSSPKRLSTAKRKRVTTGKRARASAAERLSIAKRVKNHDPKGVNSVEMENIFSVLSESVKGTVSSPVKDAIITEINKVIAIRIKDLLAEKEKVLAENNVIETSKNNLIEGANRAEPMSSAESVAVKSKTAEDRASERRESIGIIKDVGEVEVASTCNEENIQFITMPSKSVQTERTKAWHGESGILPKILINNMKELENNIQTGNGLFGSEETPPFEASFMFNMNRHMDQFEESFGKDKRAKEGEDETEEENCLPPPAKKRKKYTENVIGELRNLQNSRLERLEDLNRSLKINTCALVYLCRAIESSADKKAQAINILSNAIKNVGNFLYTTFG